eukprot:364454-Chlamydomonas_euryale.AAC.4
MVVVGSAPTKVGRCVHAGCVHAHMTCTPTCTAIQQPLDEHFDIHRTAGSASPPRRGAPTLSRGSLNTHVAPRPHTRPAQQTSPRFAVPQDPALALTRTAAHPP